MSDEPLKEKPLKEELVKEDPIEAGSLEQGQEDESPVEASPGNLLEQAELICQQARFKETLLRHLAVPQPDLTQSDSLQLDLLPDLNQGQLIMDIHPDDQMLLHSLNHHRNAAVALSQYFSISLQQFNAARQVMQSCFGPQLENIKVLDFACGYGRLLRFMSMLIPPQNLWASEIQPAALEFAIQTFGVRGVLSTSDPRDFEVDERFDFIWVASLFSHLPDDLFKAWMGKLCSLLTPDGVLCFSVRGSELMPAGEILPDSGILYQRASELTPLDADIYGTAYVSEPYVHGCIDEQLGLGHGYSRIPRALANEQDLYLLGKDPDRTLPGLDGFDKGLWGWVDLLELDHNNKLKMEGWAASMGDAALENVEICIDGEVSDVQTGIQRQDVATAFAEPGLLNSGWVFSKRLKLSPRPSSQLATASTARSPTLSPKLSPTRSPRPSPYIEVSAHSTEGDLALLYAGTVERSGDKPSLSRRGLVTTLVLATLMLLVLFLTREKVQLTVPDQLATPTEQATTEQTSTNQAAKPRRLQLPPLADGDYDWIAARIFENEAASQIRYLTFWGEGEDFPSFGIGHFIWFPSAVNAPFDEQFPDMVAYVSQRAASDPPLPEWMRDLVPFDAPWKNKVDFDQAWSSTEMAGLRDWLQATARWQARFIVATFEQRWQALEVTAADKQQLTNLLQQLAGSAAGLFAIIDYYNFKGLGVNPRERYQGQGWGLIQVLQAMAAFNPALGPEVTSFVITDVALVEQFSEAAAARLSLRVELAPPERNEKRWLPGWLKRLQGYVSMAETDTE